MGVIEAISGRLNMRKPINILGLFVALAILFGVVFYIGKWITPDPVQRGLSPADVAQIQGPIVRRQDSLYRANAAERSRQADSAREALTPLLQSFLEFQKNQPTRDEKYTTTFNATDSVLYRRWRTRYGAK